MIMKPARESAGKAGRPCRRSRHAWHGFPPRNIQAPASAAPGTDSTDDYPYAEEIPAHSKVILRVAVILRANHLPLATQTAPFQYL
jgi:hypothetical protein